MPHDSPEDPDVRPPLPEFVGEAASLEQFFREQLAEFIDPAIPWLMDCIDWHAVQKQMEGATYRYTLADHAVYRIDVSHLD